MMRAGRWSNGRLTLRCGSGRVIPQASNHYISKAKFTLLVKIAWKRWRRRWKILAAILVVGWLLFVFIISDVLILGPLPGKSSMQGPPITKLFRSMAARSKCGLQVIAVAARGRNALLRIFLNSPGIQRGRSRSCAVCRPAVAPLAGGSVGRELSRRRRKRRMAAAIERGAVVAGRLRRNPKSSGSNAQVFVEANSLGDHRCVMRRRAAAGCGLRAA